MKSGPKDVRPRAPSKRQNFSQEVRETGREKGSLTGGGLGQQ